MPRPTSCRLAGRASERPISSGPFGERLEGHRVRSGPRRFCRFDALPSATLFPACSSRKGKVFGLCFPHRTSPTRVCSGTLGSGIEACGWVTPVSFVLPPAKQPDVPSADREAMAGLTPGRHPGKVPGSCARQWAAGGASTSLCSALSLSPWRPVVRPCHLWAATSVREKFPIARKPIWLGLGRKIVTRFLTHPSLPHPHPHPNSHQPRTIGSGPPGPLVKGATPHPCAGGGGGLGPGGRRRREQRWAGRAPSRRAMFT